MSTPPEDPVNADVAPGDEARPGTPGSGENVCPDCAGTGTVSGERCATCEGSGTVVQGVGGA